MAQRAGWEARIQINPNAGNGQTANWVYFACRRWSFSPEGPGLDFSNTEGKPGNPFLANARGFAATGKNLRRARGRVETATFDDTDDPFASPYNIREQVYIGLRIYPAGSGVLHQFDTVYVERVTLEGEVGGSQPFSFEFISDGNYNFV